MRKLIEPIVMPMLKAAAKGYVTGDTLEDAMKVARQITANGHGVTMCYWHPFGAKATMVAREYGDIVKKCADEGIDFHLAIKVPAFDANRDVVLDVVENVRQQGGAVDFDSHAPEQTDDIFEVVQELGGEKLGMAVPGRWHRSIEDASRAIDLGMRIRVVKGSWPDPTDPKMDMRTGYLNVIDAIAGRARQVGVATHDDFLIDEAMKRLKATDTAFEQELLYGFPMRSAEALGANCGASLRVYVPYGAAWFPYSVKRALTDPKKLKFLAKDILHTRSFEVPPPR